MSIVKLSIIVCTHNRAYTITGCLQSIAASLSNAAPLDAEIIVVDNASGDDTSALIKKWSETCTFPVRQLYEPRKGISSARNCGIRAARGALIAFTDDDCRLSPDYIKDLLRYDAADIGLVMRGGRVELGDPTDLPITVKTENAPARWSLLMHSAKHANLSHTIIGCNMALRREAIDRIGLFDTNFGAGTNIPSGEDTDYIYRAYLTNILIEYVPDMAISHFHGRKTQTDSFKLFRNYAIGTGALYAKYIFKNIDICRPAYWDFKHAIKEIFTGKNEFMKTVGFSYGRLVAYCAVGLVRYLWAIPGRSQ